MTAAQSSRKMPGNVLLNVPGSEKTFKTPEHGLKNTLQLAYFLT